jgi:hypothetical protein
MNLPPTQESDQPLTQTLIFSRKYTFCFSVDTERIRQAETDRQTGPTIQATTTNSKGVGNDIVFQLDHYINSHMTCSSTTCYKS